ncbi:MAG: hypothetical protein ACR2FO_05955 [Actinomycetota bacterium]
MRSQSVRVAGIAGMVGGACWVVKALAILATGDQPPFLFGVAPPLFGVALIGLHARLEGQGGLPGTIGLVLAALSGLFALVGLVLPSTPGAESFSPWIFGGFIANLASLILLGIAVRRSGTLPGRGRLLPLVLGISTIPLIAVGGALESVNERLLEVPLVLIGVAWIGLGYLIAFAARPQESVQGGDH